MANVTNQTNYAGTSAADSIEGTSGNDSLQGAAGNDTIKGLAGNDTLVGGAGDDSIDGGSGYNIVRVQGTADAFSWNVNAAGAVLLTDTIVNAADLVDGSNEGVDTLTNIQEIQYVRPDGTLESTFVLDDFSNAPDASNTQIQYGVWVTGRANFYGDVDYFKLATVAGQKVAVSGGAGSSWGYLTDSLTGYQFQNNSFYLGNSRVLSGTWTTSGTFDVLWRSTDLNSSTPMASKGYGFILRRQMDGTDSNDRLDAGSNYEKLVGGVGNDTLVGSVRSDQLDGGTGEDVMTGGAGNDEIDGGAGLANVATFSGNRSDYTISWNGYQDLGLIIRDKVIDRDGTDTLRNVQILRFTDGDVVLDAESNVPNSVGAVAIGQAMSGTLPITRTGESSEVDIDYFQQKLSSDISTGSSLRITVTTSAVNVGNFYGTGWLQFYYNGTTEALTFNNLSSGGTLNQFRFDFSNTQRETSWIVSPLRWGMSTDFLATAQRADVQVSGYVTDYSKTAQLGDSASYTIRLDRVLFGTTAADTIVGDGLAGYIEGRDGNDKVTGSAISEQILGGTGDDTLLGGEGDDTLVAGSGNDSLAGGAGNDVLDLSDAMAGMPSSQSETVDGGDGIDTLKLSGGQSLTGLTIRNLEVLQGSGGTASYTPESLSSLGFTTVNNLTFSLSASGVLDASALSGALNLSGSSGDDRLVGTDQANYFYGNGGQDTLIGGGGDDTFQFSSGAQNASFLGSVEGGTGTDTLWLTGMGNTDITNLSITGVEQLKGYGSYGNQVLKLKPEQLNALSAISNIPYFSFAGGGSIELSKLQSLGVSNWVIADSLAYTITGTTGADSINLGSGAMKVNAGDGNDTITIDGKARVTDTLDGGAGSDILRVTGSDVDLSGATLSAIESIQVSSTSLSLTAAQWSAFTNITRVAGANTAYILSIPTAGTTTLAAGSTYVGLTGSSGDDRLIGNADNNILVGGDGSDVLTGNAGNDRLVTGAGLDNLIGGEGDDTLVITGKSTSRDSYDGGAGSDTLFVTESVDLTGSTISNVEVLDGTGTVILIPAQLASFAEVRGLTVQLSGSSSELSISATKLGAGAKVLFPQADPTITLSAGILGSKSDDTINGGSSADLIYGGRGSDRLDGGAGADTLVGGSGTDTLLGGAGDDVFRVEAAEFTSYTTTYSDVMDGGLGTDTLEINFSSGLSSLNGINYVINGGAISNIDRLIINNANNSWQPIVDITADNWSALTSFLSSSASSAPYYGPTLRISGNKNNIKFNAIDAASNIGKINLTGVYYDIDASAIALGQTASISYDTALNYHSISVNSFDNILLSAGNDFLQVNNDVSFSVNAGAGDDVIKLSLNGNLAAKINGGLGTDTLDLSNNSFIDLTQSTLAGMESIKHGTTTLVVTDTQLATWSFDGTGPKFTKQGNSIVGTSGNDSYTGNGGASSSFQGAGGDDTINNVNTAVFTGNKASYSWTRTSGSTIKIQQDGGSLGDGTDTLTGVMNLKFADVTVPLDDAPDSTYSYGMMGNTTSYVWSDLTLAAYDKRISARKDYASDIDIFSATLAPNSPLAIAASSDKGSGFNVNFKDVATGQDIQFKSLVNGQISWQYSNWMSASDKWLPGFNNADGFKAYQGGDVVLQYNLYGTDIQNYAFTLSYLDDYAGSVDTQGQMDALVGEVRGYVGDMADADWIRTSLIAGTKYEFKLKGLASGGGSLIDPKLQLLDSRGNLIESGLDLQANVLGGDDSLVFRPTTTGTYYLSVTDVGAIAKGSWTLTQQSLDTVAGNTSTTERIEWTAGQQFSVSSEINVLSDHDWFKVWLDRGMTYSFREIGSSGAGGTLVDPQLSLLSATGILLALDDNSGGGSDAKLIYRPTDSGWYYLDAGASGNAGKGTYTLSGSTLADDFGNNILTNGVVQAGTPVQGLISYNGDTDWFKTGFTKGQMYVIDAVGDESATAKLDPLVDPLIIIHDATGKQVFKADDFGGSLDARAYFIPAADGQYFIEVKSAFRYDTGAYQLTVGAAPVDDFNDTVAQAVATPGKAGALVLGTPLNGVLGVPGDHDMFRVSMEAGRTYQLRAEGLAAHQGTLADPYLRVFDADGHLLDFANGGGTGNDAMLYFSPLTTASYYLEASSNDDRGMGTYQVSAVQRDIPADDVPNNMSTGVSLTPGESFAGQLLTHNDQDWFKIALTAKQNYVFRVRASESGYGSLLDPVLEIRAGDGSLVKTIDNGVISHEPATAFTPTSTGTYFLVVKAANGQTDTGSYTLLTRAPDDHSDTLPGATTLTRDVALAGNIQWSYGAFGVRSYDSIGIATDADEDWFQFSASANEVLSVTVTPTTGSTVSRLLVEIVDSTGRSFAIGDGMETVNGNATASFKAITAGSYYARVIDGAGATGSYTVQVAAGDASDEDAAGAVSLSFVSNGAVSKAEKTAKIGLAGDVDQFTVDLQAGHQYRLETLAVRDGAQAPLASASMALSFTPTGGTAVSVSSVQSVAEPSLYDTASFTADSSGRMSIDVKPLDPTQTGQYKVRVVDLGGSNVDDRPDQVSAYKDTTNGVLAVNESAKGQIGTASDNDLFAINLTKGNLYDFSVKGFGDGLGTLAQPTLRLVDANGALLTVGNFDGTTGRTDLAVSVFDTGRYYLSVSAVNTPGNIGTYQLDTRLRDAATAGTDDICGDTRSGVSVRAGSPTAGRINYAGDEDWISASLVAGKVYVVDVLANGAGSSGVVGGTLKDATLRLIDASGAELMQDDNSGAGLDPRLLITPTADGTYYFDVGANGAELGTYTLRLRELYSGLADPLQSAQWYLPALGLDKLNGQVSGAGVNVGMVDDGIDLNHPDLQGREDLSKDYDAQFKTTDGGHKYPPMIGLPPDAHGTAVAGIIVGEQNNQTGIVGIAPDAHIVSTRVKWTWDQITDALGHQYLFDISNNSWGAIDPFSDNFNSTTLTFAYEALRKGVEDGRKGLGTVFVFSAGNSAAYGENTNYHNFQNAREVITVAAANADGSVASFSTPGASVLVGAYGVDLLTTDRIAGLGYSAGNYTSFSGTSAAAPVVSAVAALMLEANPALGYRDVQQILALSASHPDSLSWKTNGASQWNLGGMLFNDQLGFGLVDAYAAVQLADTWTQSDTAINESFSSARAFGLQAEIPDGVGAYSKTFHIDSNISVEHVELGVDLRHTRLGDLVIELTSPSGTVTSLMDRPTVNADQPFGLSGADSGVPTHLLWDLSSVQFWGEQASGDWTVSVRDVRAEEKGTLSSLSLRIYGALDNGNDTYVFTEEGFKTPSNIVLQDESGIDTVNASVMLHDMFIDLPNGSISAEGVTARIASWTVIENAITGLGNDRIDGNSANNTLQGRDGNDTLQGGLGNDTLIGGPGKDTAVYAGAIAEYGVTYNPTTQTITVVDNLLTNGNEGTDSLSGIERLVFKDGEISLGSKVGNHAPVANKTLFDTTIKVGKGMGIQFDLPANAFSDPDVKNTATSGALDITVTSESGAELPSWLSFDPLTGTLSGVPPEGEQGLIKLKLQAQDEFGDAASGVLSFQLGDNQAPLLDAARELVVDEDAGLTNLGINVPVDPEKTAVTVTISELPSLGQVLRRDGSVLTVGAVIAADEMDELNYKSAADANGNGGTLLYTAKDADGVTATSSVHIFVTAVNDAPRYSRGDSKLVIQYPAQKTVALDMATPSDLESSLSTVKVVELPALGQVKLADTVLALNQVLTLKELTLLSFTLNENISGPIGKLTIQATDPQGLSSNWSLNLEVQGAAYSNQGTAGNDSIYGSTLNDTLYGMAGDDSLIGNAGDDRLLGGLGNDSLFGGSGNDSLDGSSGNDYLDGGSGSDMLTGGPGNDTYIVDSITDVVLEVIATGSGGNDLIITSVSLTAPTNVENLQATAGVEINLTGNELDNILVGNDLANSLLGGSGRDTLSGGAGNDTLDGGVGVDRLLGGLGNDTYYVDSRLDVIVEILGEGVDSVVASTSYTLAANLENLTLLDGGDWTGAGNSLDNYIKGNSGSNILSGGLGRDTLDGGAGNDIYILNDKVDVIIDSAGTDTIRSSLDIVLPDFIENGELIGISGSYVTGNASNNLLVGNSGDNVLDGLAGCDTLTGGAGSDQFVISKNAVGVAADNITDFVAGSDLLVIDLQSFGVNPVALGLTSSGTVLAGSLVKGAGVRALDNNDYFLLDTAQGILKFDADGNGATAPVDLIKFVGVVDNNFASTDIYVAI